MRGAMIDFSSWSSILTTVLSLLLITLLMVGIRLVFMQTIQRRRERENLQINERLKTLIAAYKVLGGSFTGQLAVSPVHLRDIHLAARSTEPSDESTAQPTETLDDDDAELADTPPPCPVTNANAAPAMWSRPRCPTSSCWVPKNR